MGHQILIIALTGTHNPALPADLTQHLAAKGLQIRHACLSYEGRTTFAVGTPDELAHELTDAGHPTGIIDNAQVGEKSITLETVLEEVRAHHTAFRKFAAYEKKDDKEPKPRGKKEAPAPPATTGPQVTDNAQPETTEAGTVAAPEVNSVPSPSEAPDAKENTDAPGNKES